MPVNDNPNERRRFLKFGARTLLAASAWPALAATRRRDAPRLRHADARPNLIFILADDLGWADLGCYGRADYATPNIDSIGRDGVLFTDGYANSCVCTPTRVAFFTGRYQQRLPFPEGWGGPDYGIPAEHPTIASLLDAAGYETALIGKWHCGTLPKFSPLKSGFKHFFGIYGGGVDYFTHRGWDGLPDLYEDDVPIERHGYITQLLTDRAIDFVHQQAGHGPFYLSLHYTAPHWPWEGPEDASLNHWANNKPLSGSHATPAIYAAMMRSLDQQVGRLLDALAEAGQAHNTLVIFTSDNGGERLSHEYPFVGHKGNLYEGGIRVPVLARWPARIHPGQHSRQVNVTMDWTATMLAAAGVGADPSYPLDGISLLPQLEGSAPPVERSLFWRYNFLEGQLNQGALRQGRFKYLKLTDGIEQLYDLGGPVRMSSDPRDNPESVAYNLAGHREYSSLVQTLRAAYQHWDSSLQAPHVSTAISLKGASTRLQPGGNGQDGGYGYP